MDPWEHAIGDVVYLKVRDVNVRGMVTAITIRPFGTTFEVTWPHTVSFHYAIELTAEYEPTFGGTWSEHAVR
jgi:hypothetical protein